MHKQADPALTGLDFYKLRVSYADVAFIEQRLGDDFSRQQASDDEKYFASLSQAKTYVNSHFESGAE
ncbi:hypothetical protein [Dyadobacter alkalitolerans]|uniref:hypothetical protein n=1 Tax=Dyadobacter alkalitolerans TaxID=492736 RepID=UPI00047A5251|nr:hypothetical protein [Dyadobacter alkalitolerans]